MTSSSRDFFEIGGIFCTSLLLFTWGVGALEVIGFESRFYLFALEMWRYGGSWFPTTYHQFYPDYPATSTWLIYLSARLLGGMSKLAAVLPSAVAASMVVVMTYCIGALRDKRWGLNAVFFLLMTVFFIKSARSITLDIYPTMITVCCFYIIYAADLKNDYSYAWLIYPLLLLGFAFRGPIGLVIPAGVICVYYLQDGNIKGLFFSGIFSLLLLIFSLLLLLALAHSYGGHAFVHDVLRMEVFGRMEKSYLPVYFYFVSGIKEYALSFPLALVVCVGAVYYERRTRYHSADLKLLLKLFGWMMVVLLGMSIPGDKKMRYVLAMTPAIALIASYPFIAPTTKKYFSSLRWLLLRFFLFLPVILFIGMRMILSYSKNHALDFEINYLLMTQVLFVLFACGFLVVICCGKSNRWRDTSIIAIAALSFVLGYIWVAEPVEQYADRTRAFVVATEVARGQARARLVFYKETPDSLPIKYLINERDSELPVFIDNEAGLVAYDVPAFFVTSEVYYDALSLRVASQLRLVAKGKIGHVPVVIFTNR